MGNSCTYRVSGRSAQFTVRVGIPALVDGQIWHSRSGCTPEGLLVRHDGDRLFYLNPYAGRPAGPRAFELISARVGAVIEPAPRTRFTVSPDSLGAGEPYCFRSRANPPAAVALSFAGPGYDLVPRQEVYRWSMGRALIQTTHGILISGEWCVPLSIPRPPVPVAGQET